MKRKVKDILAEYESTGDMMSYSDFKVCLDAIYYHIREAALHKDGSYQARKHLKTADRICDFVADMFCDQHNNLVSWLKGEPCTFYHPTMSPHCINRAIERICRDYNKEEEIIAKQERREEVLLPRFSVHQLRHTFCTRFCENERDLKVIQEIMGHADISTMKPID